MVDVSNLFIDKLSLAFHCDENTGAKITAKIRRVHESRGLPINYLGPRHQNRGYRHYWELTIPGHGNNARALLMTNPELNLDAAYFSIEWNPNNLGHDGNHVLWNNIEYILCNDFTEFFETAIVNRIDFTVEVSPLSPESIFATARHSRRGDILTGDHGEIQSIGIGSRGSATSFCIYNRDQSARDQFSTSPNCTRIEARCRPRMTMRELQSISIINPFSRLLVVDAVDLHDVRANRRMFVDSVRLRGLHGALLLFDNYGTRNTFRNWMEDNRLPEWFNADNIWSGYNQAFDILALERFLGPHRWRICRGKRIRKKVRS